jgi:rare lipoprotein A
VGSFAAEENARRLESRLAGAFPEVEVVRRAIAGEMYFRVRVGNFGTRSDALSVARSLASQGFDVIILERHR